MTLHVIHVIGWSLLIGLGTFLTLLTTVEAGNINDRQTWQAVYFCAAIAGVGTLISFLIFL